MMHRIFTIALPICLKAAGFVLASILIAAPGAMVAGGMVLDGVWGPRAAQVFEAQVFYLYIASWRATFVLAPIALSAFLLATLSQRFEARSAR